jgi:hypothetical protein
MEQPRPAEYLAAWNSLDRLNTWLRDQGFWYWWTRNDLEPVGSAIVELEVEPLDFPSIETG